MSRGQQSAKYGRQSRQTLMARGNSIFFNLPLTEIHIFLIVPTTTLYQAVFGDEIDIFFLIPTRRIPMKQMKH